MQSVAIEGIFFRAKFYRMKDLFRVGVWMRSDFKIEGSTGCLFNDVKQCRVADFNYYINFNQHNHREFQ